MSSAAKFRSVVVACARWENRYVVEWINYQKFIGFDHVYLYCNDDDPTDLYETVAPFLGNERPFLTFYYYPFVGHQHMLYMHFLRNHLHEAEWISFLDIDEFLRLPLRQKVHDFIGNFENRADSIYLNWCCFGNNGFSERPEGSVLKNYTRRSAGIFNRMTKHITRASVVDPDLIRYGAGTDFWHYWNGADNFREMRIVNVLGDDMHQYYEDPEQTDTYLAEPGRFDALLENGIINHYLYKSREDFLIRAKRSTASVFAQQAWYGKAFYSGEVDGILGQLNQLDDTYLADLWQAHLNQGWSRNVFPLPNDALISLGKRADQSSIGPLSLGGSTQEDAAGAVDGVIDGNYSFHTDLEESPWWQVDLGAAFEITDLRIFNCVSSGDMAARAAALKVEFSVDGAEWQEVFRRTDNGAFGGADGRPLIWRSVESNYARLVRITLLSRNYLHLDQVQIFGRPIDNFDSEAPRSLSASRAEDTQYFGGVHVDDKAIFSRFISLGVNCEFGVVQKNVDVNQNGLLDWLTVEPDVLVDLLSANFEGVDDIGSIELISEKKEYVLLHRRFRIVGHTWIEPEASNVDKTRKMFAARFKFLRRKMIEELQDGDRVFVYKMNGAPVPDETIFQIASLIRGYGPGVLFSVSDARFSGKPHGHVEWIGENILAGHLSTLSPLNSAADVDVSAWRSLCSQALDLLSVRGGSPAAGVMAFGDFGVRAVVHHEKCDLLNLAVGKPCLQSSVSTWSRFQDVVADASGAVSGRPSGRAGFHTDLEDDPWWQVDLRDVYGILEVKILNRLDVDGVSWRSSRLAIDVGVSADNFVEVYRRETNKPFGGVDGNPLVFKPTIPIPGRFVRVRLLTRNYLHLDQVEVYGEPLPFGFFQAQSAIVDAE